MPLATCSKFLRPSLSRISPVLRSLQLGRCRLFSSLEKRPNLAVNRLSARHASDGPQTSSSEWPISDNVLVVLGFSLLGSTLFFVSIFCTRFLIFLLASLDMLSAMLIWNLVISFKAVYSGLLDPEGVRSKIPGGSRKRAEVLNKHFRKQNCVIFHHPLLIAQFIEY